MKRALIAVILFPIVLILLNFYFLVFDFTFYEQEFTKYNIYSKYSKETIDNNAKILIEYLKYNIPSLDSDFFNEKEKLHMVDVRNLISKTNYILLFSVLVLLILLIWTRNKFLKIIEKGAILTLALVMFVYLLSPYFGILFTEFHKLAFNNDYWLLDPEKDNLKYMFPDEFFYDFLTAVFIRSAFISLLIILISRKDLYINKLKKLTWPSQK